MSQQIKAEEILGNLVSAVQLLEECQEFTNLIPEVRTNLAFALPGATTVKEVAAIDGRITAVCGFPRASGLPKWGASDHMARLLIEVQKYDTTLNAGINFKCDSDVIQVVQEYCSEHNIAFGWIDRTKEPDDVAEEDRKSMPWKVKQLLITAGAIPKLFYEGEGWGKEPLFIALGRDTVEVVTIATDIASRYANLISF